MTWCQNSKKRNVIIREIDVFRLVFSNFFQKKLFPGSVCIRKRYTCMFTHVYRIIAIIAYGWIRKFRDTLSPIMWFLSHFSQSVTRCMISGINGTVVLSRSALATRCSCRSSASSDTGRGPPKLTCPQVHGHDLTITRVPSHLCTYMRCICIIYRYMVFLKKNVLGRFGVTCTHTTPAGVTSRGAM